MGWLTFNYQGTAKQYFTKMINETKGLELIDISIKNFRTVYLAVKDVERGYVFCQVFLIHRAPKSYYNFGYKDISEFCGPVQSECPKRILDKLTPIEEFESLDGFSENSLKWAKEWRERCRENIENSKKQKSLFSKGRVVKLENPLNFTNGKKFQYFKKVKNQWYAIDNFGTDREISYKVKLRGIKNLKFKSIENQEAL
jgi:hypothetical protein